MDQGGYRADARPGSAAPVQPKNVQRQDSDAADDTDELAELDPRRESRSVTLDDLDEAEQHEAVRHAAENLARRAADGRLRAELARNDFSGPGYTYFAEELAAYGFAVCRAWLVTGEMFVQCGRRGYAIGSGPERWGEHDVDGLVGETVTQALRQFRAKGLRGGGWREDGGASLKTYFITGCVYAFLNAYRAWRTERERWSSESTFEPADVELFDHPGDHDVASHALTRIEAAEACSTKSHYQQQLLTLRGLGYSHTEIAELLDRAPSAIERAFHRMRRAAERHAPDQSGPSS